MPDLLDRLAHWIATHRSGQVLAVLTALGNAWRALPAPWRAAIERRHPRAVGVVRALYEALPSFVGAAFALYWQFARGVPKEDVQATRPPGAPPPPPPPPPPRLPGDDPHPTPAETPASKASRRPPGAPPAGDPP